MAQDQLPDDVQKLIGEHITSVEQLEILLLLRDRPEPGWTARRVSEEMRTSERSAATRLEDLRKRGFLARREEGGESVYGFAPASEWLRRTVGRLASAYAERRYTVIDLIFAKPIDRLRVYADAFRFRKDDSDG